VLTCNADTVGFTIHPLPPHSHPHPTRILCLASSCQCACLMIGVVATGSQSAWAGSIRIYDQRACAVRPDFWTNAYTIMIGTEQTWLRTEALPQWDAALRAGFWNGQKAILDAIYNPAIPDGDSHAISVGFGLFWQGSGHFFGIIPCGDSEKALRPKGIKLSCRKFGPSLKTLIRRSMERTGPRSTSVRSICA